MKNSLNKAKETLGLDPIRDYTRNEIVQAYVRIIQNPDLPDRLFDIVRSAYTRLLLDLKHKQHE